LNPKCTSHSLRYGDIMPTWNTQHQRRKLLSSMVFRFVATLTRDIQIIASIIHPAANISSKASRICTLKYGKRIMARSPTGIKFTIATVIRSIMKLIISNRSVPMTIPIFTEKRGECAQPSRFRSRAERRRFALARLTGTDRKRAGSGIKNIAKAFGRIASRFNISANSVRSLLSRVRLAGSGFVRIHASLNGGEPPGSIMSHGSALGRTAVFCSRQIDMMKSNTAQGRVRTRNRTKKPPDGGLNTNSTIERHGFISFANALKSRL